MELSEHFWETQAHRIILGSDGSLRFTAAGKEHFGPQLARNGFAISQITTVEAFRAAMAVVVEVGLEQNTREMEDLLADPKTSQADREVLLKILGRTEDSPPPRVRLRVVK